jgi:hypothetical protein
MAVYINACYGNPESEAWIREEYAKRGMKLDMGKCCIRFKKVEDLALDVIAEAIGRCETAAYIERYESLLPSSKSPKKK